MKHERIIIEIRAAEGGSDSKLLVEDLVSIYSKTAKIKEFNFEISEQRPGMCVIWLTGNEVKKCFANESGNHQWVRVPPTEKRGRTQTSIISVAIIDPDDKFIFEMNREGVTKNYIRGTGNGGQAINKTSSCVQLVHKESGTIIKCQETRDRSKNEELAWKKLEEKLKDVDKRKHDEHLYANRFNQIGYSGRSSKRRTYRLKDNLVTDHVTGKTCQYKDFSRGRLELLC